MWTYNNQQLTEPFEDYLGFIYLITNISSGRKYVGKKKFWNKTIKYKTVTQKNGVKKKKRIRGLVESDWKDYWSSSEELQNEVKTLGESNFTREILYLCKTDAEMSYMECRELYDRRVLESLDYYNAWIMCRVRKDNILHKLTIPH